jgi:hypothetical protein
MRVTILTEASRRAWPSGANLCRLYFRPMRIAGRPFGLLALAVLAVGGALWALTGVAGLRAVPEVSLKGIEVSAELVRLIIAGWSAVLLTGALLLLALHRWGWVLLMLATGLGLLAALWQWWLGSAEPIRLALLVVTAFYLNGRSVRDLLLRPVERAGVVPLAPQEGGRR